MFLFLFLQWSVGDQYTNKGPRVSRIFLNWPNALLAVNSLVGARSALRFASERLRELIAAKS